MAAPRKKKRKTSRPLEAVPLRKLVSSVKSEIQAKARASLAAAGKPKRD